jgi:hypothetical protein
MPPPRAPAKRDAPATPTSSPSTPSAAPGTPAESVEEPRKKKQRKAEEQTPLTAVQKARDMCTKLLKKKNDAGTLTLTLQTLPYAEALSKEMEKYAMQFEFFGRSGVCALQPFQKNL